MEVVGFVMDHRGRGSLKVVMLLIYNLNQDQLHRTVLRQCRFNSCLTNTEFPSDTRSDSILKSVAYLLLTGGQLALQIGA